MPESRIAISGQVLIILVMGYREVYCFSIFKRPCYNGIWCGRRGSNLDPPWVSSGYDVSLFFHLSIFKRPCCGGKKFGVIIFHFSIFTFHFSNVLVIVWCESFYFYFSFFNSISFHTSFYFPSGFALPSLCLRSGFALRVEAKRLHRGSTEGAYRDCSRVGEWGVKETWGSSKIWKVS